MGFRDYLKNLITTKRAKIADLQSQSDASNDVSEVRAIGQQLAALRDEINEAEKQLEQLEDDDSGADGSGQDGSGAGDDQRSGSSADAIVRNGQVVGSFNSVNARSSEEDPFDTLEYRKAFMEFVCRNTPIPADLRADEVTNTTDVGAVIPTTILNEIIQKLDSYGNVYALVRKLNIQGGVAIPVLSLKPEATWVGEGKSESKKLDAKNSISFSYFGVECKIAQSLLVNVTTLEAFQSLFVPLATEAIVKAVEIAIFNGDGVNKPTGILNDKNIPAENIISITPEEVKTWNGWHIAVKAKIKKGYRNGTFFMNQSTFDGHIDGMVDDNGQPIGRTNYGINGEETYRFMGKPVETVEDDCLPSYDDASEDEAFAVYMKPTDYVINSNLQMTVVKWTDHDDNQLKNKCILICDGKLVDPNGVLVIKKGASIPSV